MRRSLTLLHVGGFFNLNALRAERFAVKTTRCFSVGLRIRSLQIFKSYGHKRKVNLAFGKSHSNSHGSGVRRGDRRGQKVEPPLAEIPTTLLSDCGCVLVPSSAAYGY